MIPRLESPAKDCRSFWARLFQEYPIVIRRGDRRLMLSVVYGHQLGETQVAFGLTPVAAVAIMALGHNTLVAGTL